MANRAALLCLEDWVMAIAAERALGWVRRLRARWMLSERLPLAFECQDLKRVVVVAAKERIKVSHPRFRFG